MKKPLVLSFVMVAILLFFSANSYAIITLGFSPASQTVNSGDPVDVQIVIAGLGSGTAPSLGAFYLNVSFNPAILNFISLTFGDPNSGDQLDIAGGGSLTFPGPFITSPGSLNLWEESFDTIDDLNNYQAGTFTLATLSFTTLAPGISPLAITDPVLSDAWGDPLYAGELHSGEINVVSAVPEPATLLLAGIGLAGLWCFRKRMRCS